MQSTPYFQSEIEKLRHDVEEYAKKFPTIGFEKETMKYKSWERNPVWYEIIIEDINFWLDMVGCVNNVTG